MDGTNDGARGFGREDTRDTVAIYCTPQNGFAELADTYDARLAGNPLHLLESTETLAALPDLGDRNVVDLGCGTGRYTLQLARLGAASVTGIDLCPEMLACAERKARRAELPVAWRVGDLTGTLPMADATVDVAVCAVVLSFLPDLTTPFAEMARVLRSDGTLILSDHHPHGLHQARADSLGDGRQDRAPYLRFTTAGGEERRIVQHPYRLADLFAAATNAGLILEHLAEPVCDRRLANTYAGLRGRIGVPLALIARFRKP
ncbi:MAG: class I SAM-dependent methyltransferase [Capsulimonadales bacterium]|nr:class I SAM-dependent methyltransferase [Capsulimonadales bacterium]